MPRCKNSEKPCYYTGKEDTPRGKGYSAKYEDEGKKMKGTDGKMYKVSGNRWVILKSKNKVVSPRGFNERDSRYEENPLFHRPSRGEMLENLRSGEMMKYGDDFDDEKLESIKQIKTITPDEARSLMRYPLSVITSLIGRVDLFEKNGTPFDIIEMAEDENVEYERLINDINDLSGGLPQEEIERLKTVDSTTLVVLK